MFVGVQHAADHRVHGVRHQDAEGAGELQRGQVHRVHDVHHLHHLARLCRPLLWHRQQLSGLLLKYLIVFHLITSLV